MSTVIGIIKGLTTWLRQKGASPAAVAPSATVTPVGIGQATRGPQQRETRSYEVGQLNNGYIETNVEIVQRNGPTLEVHILERTVETANGTIAAAGQLKSICGVCRGSSDRGDLYCQECSIALCIKHLGCIQLKDTGEILRLCPACEARLRATWNPWRGKLPPSFSVTALDRIQDKNR